MEAAGDALADTGGEELLFGAFARAFPLLSRQFRRRPFLWARSPQQRKRPEKRRF